MQSMVTGLFVIHWRANIPVFVCTSILLRPFACRSVDMLTVLLFFPTCGGKDLGASTSCPCVLCTPCPWGYLSPRGLPHCGPDPCRCGRRWYSRPLIHRSKWACTPSGPCVFSCLAHTGVLGGTPWMPRGSRPLKSCWEWRLWKTAWPGHQLTASTSKISGMTGFVVGLR